MKWRNTMQWNNKNSKQNAKMPPKHKWHRTKYSIGRMNGQANWQSVGRLVSQFGLLIFICTQHMWNIKTLHRERREKKANTAKQIQQCQSIETLTADKIFNMISMCYYTVTVITVLCVCFFSSLKFVFVFACLFVWFVCLLFTSTSILCHCPLLTAFACYFSCFVHQYDI